ncbi:WD40 repeat domain-containing protein [Caldalkalibacillus salinus]|uniref:WD40 repeat domain-containing protein n=1 Tax=Caldalkalibacillus salinus TaxID=2803787 RepID=UPI0019211ABA|nr:WD40 repeat domain-containing protein [Caldalkalibacillus salinus]
MHKGPITCVVVSKDGRTVYTGGYDKRLFAWDRKNDTYELVTEHEHLITSLALSSDGETLACGSSDHTISLHNTKSNQLIGKLIGHSDDIETVAFGKDDQWLVSGSNNLDSRVLVWDLKTKSIVQQFKGHHNGSVNDIHVFGDRVYSAADDGNVFIWDIHTGQVIKNLAPFDCDLDACDGNNEKGLFALGMDDGTVIFYDSYSGKELDKFSAHEFGVKCLTFSPSGSQFLTAGYDHQIKIWSTDSLELISTLPSYQYQWERSVVWTPDEKCIVGGSFGVKYCIWDIEKEQFVGHDTERATPSINDIAIDSKGNIATASDDGKFRINGDDVGEANLVLNNAVTLSLDGRYAVWGDHSSQVHLYDTIKNDIKFSLETKGPVNVIKYSSDDHSFYVGTYAGYVHQFSPDAQEWKNEWKLHTGAIKGLDISDGTMVSGSSDGSIRVINLSRAESYNIVGTLNIVDDLALTNDNDAIVVVGRDLLVRLYSLTTGKIIDQHTLHRYSLKSVDIDEDNTIYAGDYWGNVSIWNPYLNKEPKFIKVAQNGISGIQCHKNKAYAASYDGGVYSIDLTGNVREELRLFDQSKILTA